MGFQSQVRSSTEERHLTQAGFEQKYNAFGGSKAQNAHLHSVGSADVPRRFSVSVLSAQNAHLHGELYGDNLKARKRVFIDEKSWNLPQSDGMEFDQYDTPQSRSIVLHEYGKIVAGVRLLPTKARCGCYSYMLRDAQLGIIGAFPQHILYEDAPVADHVWEATRLFLSPDVPAQQRLLVQSQLMNEMSKAVVDEGATHVIGIVPSVFRRWLQRLGMGAFPVGPKVMFDSDISQAAVMHVAALGSRTPQ